MKRLNIKPLEAFIFVLGMVAGVALQLIVG